MATKCENTGVPKQFCTCASCGIPTSAPPVVQQSGYRCSDLETLAVLVAVAAPERFNVHGTSAYVPRGLILKIRAECERLGLDWRKIRRDAQEEVNRGAVRPV